MAETVITFVLLCSAANAVLFVVYRHQSDDSVGVQSRCRGTDESIS